MESFPDDFVPDHFNELDKKLIKSDAASIRSEVVKEVIKGGQADIQIGYRNPKAVEQVISELLEKGWKVRQAESHHNNEEEHRLFVSRD